MSGLVVFALVLLALGGCRDGSDDSTQEYREELAASGDRLVVTDGDGEPIGKVRVRTDRYKVYDASLAPVGFVSWGERVSTTDADEEAEAIAVRSIEATEPERIETDDEPTVEFEGRWRVERIDRGWAVFDEDAELIGRFERRDDRWQFRRDDDSSALTVEKRDGRMRIVRDDGSEAARASSDELSELELLAWQLEELDALDRAAVGVWLHHRAGDAT